ncbi:hypothetical protein SESBI_44286 [Sesbania bispinosa]|nr:hypothetical protein SESBI_44286 [Sesbania bispinosa]
MVVALNMFLKSNMWKGILLWWSYFEAVDILKEYGYNVGCKLWYLIPGMSMHDGLRSLSCDGHAMDLAAYGLSSEANVVELFVEKNVSMLAQVVTEENFRHNEVEKDKNLAEEDEAHCNIERFDDSEEEREKMETILISIVLRGLTLMQ